MDANSVVSSEMYESSIKIFPVIPLEGRTTLEFDDFDCSAEGPMINIITDAELNKDVIEVGERSRISFPVYATLHNLCIYIKSMDKFMAIIITCKCEQNLTRKLTLSNRRSNIRIDGNQCDVPLKIGESWQYLNLDMEYMLQNAFGVSYLSTIGITIEGSATLNKIFFQEREYAEAELPIYLRLLAPSQAVAETGSH